MRIASDPMRFGRGRPRLALAVLLAAGVVAGCVGPYAGDPTKLQVLTTTTVLADIAANVGGQYVQVTSLVPKNGDVHTFAPRPSDVVSASHARLIFMNGLGLDDWLNRTIDNASAGGKTVRLGDAVSAQVPLLPGENAETRNPHLFMDVKYAELYADRIAAAMEEADPAHADAYRSQAAAYRGQLDTLDAWVRTEVGSIPKANRKIVTFHDAFPYYARAYGITVVGVAVEAPGQDPNAGYIANLITDVKAAGVKAIFSEAQFPAKLADQLAAEANCKVVANLYDDALGDDVTSFEALIRWDTTQMVEALR